jgi:putative addiction module killer protein
MEIFHYLTASGKDVFESWLTSLRDDQAEARIDARINRLAGGNFGNCKPVGGGVWELRIDYGPGYRIYYARIGQEIVLLLCGGDKRKQASDIARAAKYLGDYKKRSTKS